MAAPAAAWANGDKPPPLGPPPAASAPAMEQFAYGFDLWRAQRPADAAPYFVRGLQTDPDNALAHFYLAECYRFTGKTDEAAGHYRRAIALKLDPPRMRHAEEMLQMLGEPARAKPP